MKISCVIPAYNEANRITNVIEVVKNHPLIDEVVVVDDASTDGTWDVLSKLNGVSLVRHAKNQGKAQAMLSGLAQTSSTHIMLIDADLVGLTEEAITRLVLPVLYREVDVTISLRGNALSLYKLFGIDFVSGERVFARELLEAHVDELREIPGFGLEVFMNNLILKGNLSLRVVKWPGVASPRKADKIGFFLGSLADVGMVRQVLRTIPLGTCMRQIYLMRRKSRGRMFYRLSSMFSALFLRRI